MGNAPEFAASDRAAQSAAQAAVIEFLSRPESYPGGVTAVSRIETHAAIVFLAGERAYKLKRAVKLPYLDFSTLEKRRIAIERELEINARATPGLYLAVLPVTRGADGRFELGGAGEPADWVLVMRRFQQDTLLDAIAAGGGLGGELAAELAQAVEHFHRMAPQAKGAGFADTLGRVAADLEAVLCGAEAQARGLRLAPYARRLRQELEARAPLLSAREGEGFVRRCHGDLHLRNIVLWEGKPRLFDAIEFDERLAAIDVLYDLAFLLMDLWHRGLRREANLILNHYFQGAAIGELAGLALLPLFLSVRAAIRAMTGLHALPFRDATGQETLLREIESYAALAEALLSQGRASLVAIGGISGTGKTSAAREAAPFIGAAPGALHIRTDVERKVMRGVALNRRLPPEAYGPEQRDEVYRRVCKKAEAVLDSGHSAIVDAVFPGEEWRLSLCELAHRAGAAFWGFWLVADAAAIRARLAARGESAQDASDAGPEVAEAQMKSVAPPPDWIEIDASGPPAATAAAIVKALQA